MTITLDKIDTIMERANVTYEEAQKALDDNEGDLVAALIYLEQNSKIKKRMIRDNINEKNRSFFNKVAKKIKLLHSYKFKIRKEEEQILSIPLTIAIIITLITLPFSLFILGFLFLIGYKISINARDGSFCNNTFLSNIKSDS